MSGLTWTHHAPLHPPHPLNTHTHTHTHTHSHIHFIYSLLVLYLASHLKMLGRKFYLSHPLPDSSSSCFLSVLWVFILYLLKKLLATIVVKCQALKLCLLFFEWAFILFSVFNSILVCFSDLLFFNCIFISVLVILVTLFQLTKTM